MRYLKVAAALALAAAFGTAQAFHDGGVARCSGCHTMHNSVTNGTNTTNSIATLNALPIGTVNAYLLKGQDPSSTCLNCHGATSAGSYHVYDTNTLAAGAVNPDTLNYSPGGDFTLVKQLGNRKGHNVVAAAFGLVPDARMVPPGSDGSWDGSNFSCVSCHDPHGQTRQVEGVGTWARGGAPIEGSSSYRTFEGVDGGVPGTGLAWGAYRILGSAGWQPRSSASFQITVDPPIAVAPNTYNKSENTFAGMGGTGQTVVAYVKGMSEWCATCHTAMHQNDAGSNGYGNNLRHPSGAAALLNADIVANYNKYLKTGDATGTAGATYDGFIPFEINGDRASAVAYAVDTTGTTNLAASATSTVMCLSCHRAHASGFDSMLRFSIADAFVGEWTLPNDQAAMYMRPSLIYGEFQRPLCNKCHVKD